MDKGVSIVICCYNSEKRIIPTLEHLKAQNCPTDINWEIILIDNASSDQTVTVARQFLGESSIPFKIIREERAGLSFAREAGFVNANFEYVSLVDDDNWVDQNWVKTVFEILDKNNHIGACGGRGIGEFEIKPPFWFEKFQYSYAVGPQVSMMLGDSATPYLYGAGLTIRGSSLSSGGDYELNLVLQLAGYSLHYEHNLTFKHYMTAGRLNWTYLKKLHYSFGEASTLIEIYKSELKKYKGLRRIRVTNPIICICYSIYKMVKHYPTTFYMKITHKWSEGCKEILDNEWRKGILRAQINQFWILKSMVKGVKMAKWRTYVE
jgi:glycosyltransferase involved in cell wall biosynthesis